MNIESITYLDFAFLYKTAFSSEFSNAVLRMGAGVEAIFVGFSAKEPTALAALKKYENEWELICLYVAASERHKGNAEALLKHCIAHCKEQNGQLLLRVIEGHSEEVFLCHMAKKLDFCERSRCTVYKAKPQKSEIFAYWKDFLETRGNRIIAHCEKREIRLCSFEDAQPELISALKNELGKSFLGALNPFQSTYAPQWSFIAHRNGQPVAFCTANQHGSKLILEILQANSRAAGAFAMPLFHFISKVFEQNIETAVFIVYQHNQKMRSLTKNFILPMVETGRVQIDYIL